MRRRHWASPTPVVGVVPFSHVRDDAGQNQDMFMADYYSQCVVSPMLPLADVTAAEQLVLRNMFDSELEGDELYLFAEIGRNSMIGLEIPDILVALSSTGVASVATRLLSKAVADLADGEITAEIDLDDHWLEILQEIVGRSDTLSFVAIETGFNCSKMRPDGFGGAAIVITAETIDAMSTNQFIDETLAARLGDLTHPVLDGGRSDA